MTLALKEVLLLSSIISLCVPAYAEVLITNNPYNQISYTQDIENIYFSIEILDSALIKGRYPIIDFASISVDKNKNKKIDEYLDTSYGVGNLKICGQYLINARASSTCEKLSTQATLKVYVGKTQYSQKEHSIFEFKIPKSELSFDEASAEVTFQIYSAKSKYKNYPQINDGLFTSTINIPFKHFFEDDKPLRIDGMNNSTLAAQKEELTPQEQDCLLWRKSNSIAPTPEKNKYIKNNCK